MNKQKVFRISVSGYETYSPEDFTHPTKTDADFIADVQRVLAAFPVEQMELYDVKGKQRHGWICGSTLQGYLKPELLKLGYASTNITEVDLGGECLYDNENELPDLMPKDVKERIVKRAEMTRAEMDEDMEQWRKEREASKK